MTIFAAFLEDTRDGASLIRPCVSNTPATTNGPGISSLEYPGEAESVSSQLAGVVMPISVNLM